MAFLTKAANRGSIATGYEIENSLKLEADNTEYLYKTNDAGTNRKTFTVSMWFKRTEISNDYVQLWHGGTFGDATRLGFWGGTPLDAIWVDIGGGTGTTGGSSNSGINKRSISNQVLRDTSAWYHIVLAVDTTQATEANRWRLWLNGEEVTSWYQRQYPVQDYQCALEANIDMKWGAYDSTYYKMSGYIAECHYLDGVTAVQTDFGEYDEDSGIWKPKAYAGSYGGNGCYLNFDDSASLGADSSGNGNNFTLVNITSADQATDTPTNNFATWNVAVDNAGIFSYTEGATKWKPISGAWASTTASLGFTKGKWYAEFKAASNVTNVMVGVQELSGNYVGGYSGEFANSTSEGYGYYNANGNVYNNATNSSYGNPFPLSVLVGVALDFKDDGTALMYISKDNVWQNSADPVNGTGGYSLNSGSAVEGFFSFAGSLYTSADYLQANFGGYTVNTISTSASDENGYGTFEYAPPSGYYALCTKNLAEYG